VSNSGGVWVNTPSLATIKEFFYHFDTSLLRRGSLFLPPFLQADYVNNICLNYPSTSIMDLSGKAFVLFNPLTADEG
jgi:hypothetical protein